MHIKFCGITSLEDARAAIEAGADYLGFNFHPPSPRSITPEACAQITSVLRKEYPQVQLVGVFVNLPVAEIKAILASCNLRMAQLHGDESPGMLAALSGRAFKAFRGVPVNVTGYARGEAPALLIDASVTGAYGGTGVTADWAAAADLARRFPLFLAGGLSAENVAAAIERVHPWGVDTASGVESAPGKKDPDKMQAFVEAVQRSALVSDQ
jgi:phosphoribosylanthranilate isomerase